MNINKAIQSALEHFQAGDLKQAEYECRRILEQRPGNVEALHFLGVIYFQNGQHDLAIDYIRQALRLDPNFVDAYDNPGTCLKIRSYRQNILETYNVE